MQWTNCGIRKVRENMVRRNLVGARSLEGLSALGRLGLEGLLLFMYPNWFSSGSFTTWSAAERFFAEFFSFLFDNTCRCYLVFASLFPLLLSFNFYWLWLIKSVYCLYFIFRTYIVWIYACIGKFIFVRKFRPQLIELTSFKPKLLIRFIMNKTC